MTFMYIATILAISVVIMFLFDKKEVEEKLQIFEEIDFDEDTNFYFFLYKKEETSNEKTLH